jgi:hypothetical protein
MLRRETQAWHEASNDKQRGVDWQFKIDDARRKLKSLPDKADFRSFRIAMTSGNC